MNQLPVVRNLVVIFSMAGGALFDVGSAHAQSTAATQAPAATAPQPIVAPQAVLNVDPEAPAMSNLDLARSTYTVGNTNGGGVKAGTASVLGNVAFLYCPKSGCTIEFAGQVQVAGGPGGANDINVCAQIDGKSMPNCVIQGQASGSFQAFDGRDIKTSLGQGNHRVQGFIGASKGVKVYAYVFVWRSYN